MVISKHNPNDLEWVFDVARELAVGERDKAIVGGEKVVVGAVVLDGGFDGFDNVRGVVDEEVCCDLIWSCVRGRHIYPPVGEWRASKRKIKLKRTVSLCFKIGGSFKKKDLYLNYRPIQVESAGVVSFFGGKKKETNLTIKAEGKKPSNTRPLP